MATLDAMCSQPTDFMSLLLATSQPTTGTNYEC